MRIVITQEAHRYRVHSEKHTLFLFQDQKEATGSELSLMGSSEQDEMVRSVS